MKCSRLAQQIEICAHNFQEGRAQHSCLLRRNSEWMFLVWTHTYILYVCIYIYVCKSIFCINHCFYYLLIPSTVSLFTHLWHSNRCACHTPTYIAHIYMEAQTHTQTHMHSYVDIPPTADPFISANASPHLHFYMSSLRVSTPHAEKKISCDASCR